MKIIDCFPYFNEEEHLILRINLLKDHVDKFVICEANRTHTGILKDYTVEETLKQNNLLSDKIYIHKVELPSKEEEPDNWVRERKQRNDVANLIKEDEVWFISDCDEIINPIYLKWFSNNAVNCPNNIIRVRMSFHQVKADFQLYNLNNNQPLYFDCPFFVLKHHTEKYTLSEIRESVTYEHEIEFPSIFTTIDNEIVIAGWHLSWMGSSENKIKKLKSFMHYEDFDKDGFGYLNTSKVEDYVSNFIPQEDSYDILNRKNHILKKYNINKLPELIVKNIKLKKFFLSNYIPVDYPHIYQNPSFGENWFTYPELYKEMVSKFGNNSVFVEVGSWKGKSSAYMATEIANSKKEIKFFCIDTWEGSEEHKYSSELNNLYNIFIENMKPLEKFYTPIKSLSIDASQKFENESIDFLFLDAAHDYENVKQDVLAWWPKVKKGGIFAGHDYYDNTEWGDVKKVIDELFFDFSIKTQENCFIIEKNETK